MLQKIIACVFLVISAGCSSMSVDNIFSAINDRDSEKVFMFLEMGVDPNQLDDVGFSPLYIAVGGMRDVSDVDTKHLESEEEIKIVNYLLDFGGDPNFIFKNGSSVLSKAIFHRRVMSVDMLLSRGANPNLENKYGSKPLHLAVFHCYREIINLLMAHGADINQVSSTQSLSQALADNNCEL